MSQLILNGGTQRWALNCVGFSSALFGQIASTQTRKMAMWFPIKMGQPEVKFDVIFPSESTYENFQNFVRSQQLVAVNNTQLITLNWPERNIINWSGVITKIEAGGQRFNIAPSTSVSVLLVDSMMSSRTSMASMALNGANWQTVAGFGSASGVLGGLVQDIQYYQQQYGYQPPSSVAGLLNSPTDVLTGTG